MSTGHLPGPIAVVDVETTGLFPFRHDRIVELAAIVVDGSGQIVREFATLVNPGRDIGPTSIHGLTTEDVLRAPQFGEIAGLLVEALQGTIAIAGHNVRFDQQFLECELGRIASVVPSCFTICTMKLAGGGRLADCCCDYGIAREGESHHAISDARAAAQLLAILLPDQPQLLHELCQQTRIEWPAIPVTGKQPITRDVSRRQRSAPPSYLQRLLGRVHSTVDPTATDDGIMAYVALLDRVLEDRVVEDAEADALVEMATRWGLSGEQICFAHREYVSHLALAAMADGVVTETERRDLTLVMRLLGQSDRNLDQLFLEAADKGTSMPHAAAGMSASEANLAGMRVCFTGEFQCRYNGQLISREVAEDLATKAGMIVLSSVTKKLDLLVLADPNSQSGKAKKARQYGIRILHEPVFWRTIGLSVE